MEAKCSLLHMFAKQLDELVLGSVECRHLHFCPLIECHMPGRFCSMFSFRWLELGLVVKSSSIWLLSFLSSALLRHVLLLGLSQCTILAWDQLAASNLPSKVGCRLACCCKCVVDVNVHLRSDLCSTCQFGNHPSKISAVVKCAFHGFYNDIESYLLLQLAHYDCLFVPDHDPSILQHFCKAAQVVVCISQLANILEHHLFLSVSILVILRARDIHLFC